MSALEGPSRSSVRPGQSIGSMTVPLDRERLVHYAAASGDRNRIHWDERFAQSVGLPDVIAHGMLTMGVAVELASRWAGDPGRVLACSTRFTKPVVVPWDSGAQVEVSGTVASVDEVEGTAVVDLTAEAAGEKVLGRARATVRLA